MAFLKTARAKISDPDISKESWATICKKSNPSDFANRSARKVILDSYDSKSVMLSHCTIVCSVDTEHVDLPLGKHIISGVEIERKWPDWRITKETEKFVNNNSECWERKLLLSSFKTFIGGENYVEHVQIPELSKGKIIDAAARDIGDSIYIDILVATNRKHKPLIESIRSGQLQTLSMGCSVKFTICSQCGNVAYDETHLCPHIKYFKGKTYIDEEGVERLVAELCGHIEEEPNSVVFYEASWVGMPAFPGAVVRNIFDEVNVSILTENQQRILSSGVREEQVSNAKAASLRTKKAQGEEFPGALDTPPQNPSQNEEPNLIQEAKKQVIKEIVDGALEDVRKQLVTKDVEAALPMTDTNNSIVKEAKKNVNLYKFIASKVKNKKVVDKYFEGVLRFKTAGVSNLKQNNYKTSDILKIDFICRSYFNQMKAGDVKMYSVLLNTIAKKKYTSKQAFLKDCSQLLGRPLSEYETKFLMIRAKNLLYKF